MATKLGHYRRMAEQSKRAGVQLPAGFKPEFVLALIELVEEFRDAATSSRHSATDELIMALDHFDQLEGVHYVCD